MFDPTNVLVTLEDQFGDTEPEDEVMVRCSGCGMYAKIEAMEEGGLCPSCHKNLFS